MPGGTLFGTLFFILVFFAAITSAIALIEPAVAWLTENRGLNRSRASLYAATACWTLGLGTLLSFNNWSTVTWFGKNIFELIDFITADLMLPAGGILIALFAGWIMNQRESEKELELGSRYRYWQILTKYVAPASVFIVFAHAMGLL